MDTIIGANGAQNGADSADLIKDATIETFEADVLKASMQTPVIVDFWAEWCGPCKQLAPALEKAVTAAGGKVRLVKVDIDKNQMLASQLRIQSIPTVYAFFQGRPVDGFQGAVPESEIKSFIERLTQMQGGAPDGRDETPLEDYLAAAEAKFAEGDIAAAAQIFAQIAQADGENLTALAGLARCHLAMGEIEKAKATLALVPTDKQTDPAIAGVKASIELAETAPAEGDAGALRARVEADPKDYEARFELAGALLASGAMEQAMDELLTIVEGERDWSEGAAREKLLTVFDALGQAHPATARGRRRLSSILFS